jgi:Aspartyl protease
MRRFFIFLLILITQLGCGFRTAMNMSKYLEAERMERSAFKDDISFNFINGMIIVEIEIEGKKENFVFDTGATTYIDEKLAKRLNFKKIGRVKTHDVNGKKMFPALLRLNTVKVGNTSFTSILAEINNFDHLNKAAKLGISGILGSNIMNKGVWQIDYHHKKIYFSDSRDSLNYGADKHIVGFSTFGKGTPIIRILQDSTYFDETFLDTGNRGSFDFPLGKLPVNAVFTVDKKAVSGMFSTKMIERKTVIIPNLTLGNQFKIKDAALTFSEGLHFALIGNDFLKNYVVTIDWKYQEVYFESKK